MVTTFVIQRSFRGAAKDWMPYTVHVYLPPVVNTSFHCHKCEKIYQILDDDAFKFFELVNLPPSPRADGDHYYVCDCLGTLTKPSRLIIFE